MGARSGGIADVSAGDMRGGHGQQQSGATTTCMSDRVSLGAKRAAPCADPPRHDFERIKHGYLDFVFYYLYISIQHI